MNNKQSIRRDGFLLFNEAGQIMEPTSHLRVVRRADGSEALQQLYVCIPPSMTALRKLAALIPTGLTVNSWQDIVKTDEAGTIIEDRKTTGV